MAMQFLRLANLVPIATCSPNNFDLAKSFGADEVFDYHDKNCGEKIRLTCMRYASTKGNLRYALDCIANAALCYRAIGRAGGHVATRKVVKAEWILGSNMFGRSTWPERFGRQPNKELERFGGEVFALFQRLLDQGKLKHHPLRVVDGGLEAVLEGVDMVRKGASYIRILRTSYRRCARKVSDPRVKGSHAGSRAGSRTGN
ncbi:hypothetical protein G6O67_002256 [Ophiocordyceps sinensis]|uniref:Alcohol dehydrogenase-like C-terminal domain-containing protein n=1 Tax=Ophiocordyceps sinensis TaxID=72228 RepID=A0A8H4V7B8_9HYPO|nr:hypothetical protein G6O67_002256 [Ophiocordyceps sinensis]